MKKQFTTLTTFILLLVGTASYSQGYTFSSSTEAYAPLTGSTSINGTTTWDDPTGTIPLGFDFKLFDTTVSAIHLDENGLGGELSTLPNPQGTGANIFVFGADILDRGYDTDNGEASTGSLSPISYKTEGEAGSRICKIEWKNVGFYGDIETNSSSSDFISFQLWLYEGSNKVEMRYGPSSIADYQVALEGQTGPVVAILGAYNYDTDEQEEDAFALTGDPNSPVVTKASDVFTAQLSNVPPSGSVYTFSPSTSASVLNISLDATVLYPNPVQNLLHIDAESTTYEIRIHTLDGKVLLENSKSPRHVSTEELASGVYILELQSENRTFKQRFVKQ